MSETRSIEQTFAAVPLFRRLGARKQARLAALATTRRYREGATIVRQGDTSMTLYVILSGRVRIEREIERGVTIPVGELGTAGAFGEMGLLDDEPRAATVVALEPTECALLSKWDFQTELRNDPDIALAVLPVLTQRIRELNARLGREVQPVAV